MSALFLDLLEGLDTLCQTGATALSLKSLRRDIKDGRGGDGTHAAPSSGSEWHAALSH